jgi:poly-gamma-glutamate synthesis protein (capsule biosynthesis protein)
MESKKQRLLYWFGRMVLILTAVSLTACGIVSKPLSAPTNTKAATHTTQPTSTASAVETPTPEIIEIDNSIKSVWIADYLPEGFFNNIHIPEELNLVEKPSDSDLIIGIGSERQISNWIYALVAPFPTITDEVIFSDLKTAWLTGAIETFPAQLMVVDQSTYAIFSYFWGNPNPDFVKVEESKDLLGQAWNGESVFALVPFENLAPQWKVIKVDGQSPIQKAFDPKSYSLSIPVAFSSHDHEKADLAFEEYGPDSGKPLAPFSNRDPEKLTTVALTGVTALVRATAVDMERKGINHPGEILRDILREADILHVNNEVPFADNCPFPDAANEHLVFCSSPDYMELLKDVGVDVVELTGDHFNDWGPEAMLLTLDMYDEAGMGYYGGGHSLSEAQEPLLLEHNGNKIAFLGCNAKEPGYASASDIYPGAGHCDYDWLAEKIAEVKNNGYLPIFTFQHIEYYDYIAHPLLIPDFELAAQSGAVIVSGSQAHQPHAFEFVGDSLIHYGLGNLFFDQYDQGYPTRQAFIDIHVIYDGQYISTELIPIMFVDMSQARLMTEEERIELLTTIFNASGW